MGFNGICRPRNERLKPIFVTQIKQILTKFLNFDLVNKQDLRLTPQYTYPING